MWQSSEFKGNYTAAKREEASFAEYKKSSKRQWVSEKLELVSRPS
jgi:hypothetical protein